MFARQRARWRHFRAAQWFGVWRECIVAFDPGLTNLLLGIRAAASVLLALFVLYTLTYFTGLPATLLLIGGAVAMFSMLAVDDPTLREQKVTYLFLPLPAMLSMTVGALLSPWRFIGDGVFVLVIFAAVYVRQFGSREFAFGMLAFVAYFIGTLLTPDVAILPWLFVAIVTGVASNFFMRHVILPEHPRRALKRMLRTVIALTGQILDDVTRALENENTKLLYRQSLQRRLERLNEAAISTESQLEKVLPDGDQPNPSRTRLALAVLDLELRAEQVVVSSAEPAAPAIRKRTIIALSRLRKAMRRRSLASAHQLKQVRDLQHSTLERSVRNLAGALSSLSDARINSFALQDSQLEVPATGKTDTSDAKAGKTDTAAISENRVAGLLPPTRQAIQAAAASVLAIGAGELISPHRWYWAAIAAFVVFTGTNSRGELLVKGWQRMAGTAAGVVVGVFMATAVRGHVYMESALMFVCIFMGFYLLRVSYALMIFWITILVAMVYSLLGYFSDQLLLLRLKETAVGVAAGVVVAIVLLPMSVRSRASSDSREFLSLLADTVAVCGKRLVDGRAGGELIVKARALDRQLQVLRASSQPLTRGIAGAFSRKSARRWMRSMMACRYYVTSLARVAQYVPVNELGWSSNQELSNTVAQVSRNTRILAGLGTQTDDGEMESVANRIERLFDALPGADKMPEHHARQTEILDNLARIDRLVIALARDFGTLGRH